MRNRIFIFSMMCLSLLVQHKTNAMDRSSQVAQDDGDTPCTACLQGQGVTGNYTSDHLRSLLTAAKRGHVNCLDSLLQQSKNEINGCDSIRKVTPLHVATANLHPECVELLCRNGAAVWKKDRLGRTPLHNCLVAKFSSPEHNSKLKRIVTYLVEQCDADVNSMDNSGSSIRGTALSRKYHDIDDYLRRKGAASTFDPEAEKAKQYMAQAKSDAEHEKWRQDTYNDFPC